MIDRKILNGLVVLSLLLASLLSSTAMVPSRAAPQSPSSAAKMLPSAPLAPQGPEDYRDDFDVASSGWLTHEASCCLQGCDDAREHLDYKYSLFYGDGRYHVNVPLDCLGGGNHGFTRHIYPVTLAPEVKRPSYQTCVEATAFLEEDAFWSFWGLVFAASEDKSTVYTLEVNNHGQRAIVKRSGYQFPGPNHPYLNETRFYVISYDDEAYPQPGNPGLTPNKLRVEVSHNQAWVYINDQFVHSFVDDELPSLRHVGLMGGDWEVTPAQIGYEYFSMDAGCGPLVALDGVSVDGPTQAAAGWDYVFTASASPAEATLPVTYTWQASGGLSETHVVNSLTDPVTFTWDSAGSQTITVTAANPFGGDSDTHALTVVNVPPTDLSIDGPSTALVDLSHTFTATVGPFSATLPITYTWQATDQDPVVHSGGLSDTAAFIWDQVGAKTITVTAANAGGEIAETHTVLLERLPPPDQVSISGPETGLTQADYVFGAAVLPITTVLPITYTWQATDQDPVVHTGGLSDTVGFAWPTPGPKLIQVTAANVSGEVSATQALSLTAYPIDLSADSGYANVELAWNATNSPQVSAYRLYRGISGTLTLFPFATVTGTAYWDDDPALALGETYCYQVAALDAGGQAVATSDVACATFGQVELWAPDVWAAPGETALIPVNARNADGLHVAAAEVWLNFDGSLLEPLAISSTALMEGYTWTYQVTTTQGVSQVRASTASGSPPSLHGDGSLFWLKAQVQASQGLTGPLDLRDFVDGVGGSTLTVMELPDTTLLPVPLALADGLFEAASGYSLGDLDGNGQVEVADASLALEIATHQLSPTWPQRQAGDVNGDGGVDAADGTLILYYAAHGRWPTPGQGLLSPGAINADIRLSLDEVTGRAGEQVKAVLRAGDLVDWAGGQMAVVYDRQIVEGIINVEPAGSVAAGGFELAFSDGGAGLSHLALASDAAISGSGPLLTLTLQIAADAPLGGSTPLLLAEASLNDLLGRDLAALDHVIGRRDGAVSIETHYAYLPVVIRRD